MSHDAETLKREFLEYLEIERGRARRTIENYDHYLSEFLRWSELKKAEGVTDELIRKYRLFLNRKEYTKKTQNYFLIALRQFLKYLARRGIESLPADRIELAKQGDRDLDLISSEELGRLLASPSEALAKASTPEERLKALRDIAILELFFSTGLRVAELCSLSRYLDWKRDEVSVRGKGDKVRLVFISPKAKEAIKEYLAERKDMDDALFVTGFRGAGKQEAEGRSLRITPRSVARIVKEHALRAGIDKRVSPHTLRHMFATDLLENGADIRSVQALLGHANIATTQVYTHVTDRHLKDIHKTFHGKRRD